MHQIFQRTGLPPGFQRTYEELKQDLIAMVNEIMPARFQRTYEELKLAQKVRGLGQHVGFQRTYEELKPLPAYEKKRVLKGFQRTYEELKRKRVDLVK